MLWDTLSKYIVVVFTKLNLSTFNLAQNLIKMVSFSYIFVQRTI